MLDPRDLVVGAQHVLVEEIADREIIGMIADRHHGDDLLAVEKERQRPLNHDRGLDPSAFLIDAGDASRESRISRIGAHGELAERRRIAFHALLRRCAGHHVLHIFAANMNPAHG